jgi:hypothetical protein
MRWRAHTDDHIGIIDEENPDGTLKDWSIFYQYDGMDVDDCVKHFLEAKIFATIPNPSGKSKTRWNGLARLKS